MAVYTAIDNPELYFQTVLYTGDGSANHAITLPGDTDMQPDLVWIKNRDAADSHCLFDAVRGATKVLHSNTTAVEVTDTDTLDSFTSDGFQVDADVKVNTNAEDYVAWCWKSGGGSTSTNDDGNIDSTITVDTNAGFSILTWAGDSSASATVGHGLGVAPGLIICKEINGTDYWHVFHKSLTANNNLFPNAILAQTAATDGVLASVGSSTFGFYDGGDGVVAVNETGKNNVAYCFAEKQGFSKFGSYTGNGNDDGPFIYTGFRPAWTMIKCTSASDHWPIDDNKRAPHNFMQNTLRANLTNAEYTGAAYGIDFLSNGFKVRNDDGQYNLDGGTFIYAAFAETPFVNSNGVPCNAR